MNLDDKIYVEILESGLLLDHYFLLCSIKNGRTLVNTKRIKGFVNLLTKKGYIENNELTEKGFDLVQNCGFAEVVAVSTEQEKQTQVDFGTWVAELHKKLQDKMYSLMNVRQVRTRIPGEKKLYSFLCGSTDLGKVLHKVIKLYGLKDYDKIEATLLRHIDNCAKANDWFPLMQYYVGKTKSGVFLSDLVTDMDNLEEEAVTGFKSNQKLI